MRSLGEAGLVEGESEAFLVENEVDYSPFPDEVLACLPTQLPWTAPPVRKTLLWQFIISRLCFVHCFYIACIMCSSQWKYVCSIYVHKISRNICTCSSVLTVLVHRIVI